MKIAKFTWLLALPLAAAAAAQPARPASPKPCALMPRQGEAPRPASERPRGPCPAEAFPRR